MKQLLYILLLLCIACTDSTKKPATITTKKLKPLVDVGVLQENKSHTDSLFKYAGGEEITIYVKEAGKDNLLKVVAKDLPEDIETTFNIFRDNMGHVIRIAESPNVETDDEFISCTHYFDEAGRTFAFERKINSFNCHCTNGVLFETKTEYYDEKFKPLDFTYKLLDENDRHMMKDSCRIVEYQYKVYPNVTTFLKNKSIPLSN